MYLTFARTYRPSEKILQAYREQIFDQHWARSTLNNSAFATTAYHEMLGEKVKIRSFQKREAPRLFYRA
jgi:hypothetical protein